MSSFQKREKQGTRRMKSLDQVTQFANVMTYSYPHTQTTIFFARQYIFLVLIAMEEDKLQNIMNESSFFQLVIYCKSVWLKSTNISTVLV